MRYHVPRLALGCLLPPQVRLEDKFGGHPFGLPPARWPRCRQCGAPQLLLAQLQHHPERLDLGAPGRVLYVFQCDGAGDCETWAARGGANAALIVEPEELIDGPTPLPEGAPREVEARVLEWRASEDAVQPQHARAFFSNVQHVALPDAVVDSVCEGTRLGGVPLWLQGAEEGPRAPWRFVAQLGSTHRFEGAAPEAREAGCAVNRRVDGRHVHEEPPRRMPGAPTAVWVTERGWACDGPNFGDEGCGYVFVHTEGPTPEALFFWQC